MNKWLVTLVIHTQQLSLIEWIICWYQKFALQSSTISLFFKNYSIVDVTTYISDLFIRFNKTKFFPRSQKILIETYTKICIYFLYIYIYIKIVQFKILFGMYWGLRAYFFVKKPWNVYICHFILANFWQNEASPFGIPQNCVTLPTGISKAKNWDP